jgi:hypothetical protein
MRSGQSGWHSGWQSAGHYLHLNTPLPSCSNVKANFVLKSWSATKIILSSTSNSTATIEVCRQPHRQHETVGLPPPPNRPLFHNFITFYNHLSYIPLATIIAWISTRTKSFWSKYLITASYFIDRTLTSSITCLKLALSVASKKCNC